MFSVCQKYIVRLFGTGHLKKVVKKSPNQLQEAKLNVEGLTIVTSYFCDLVHRLQPS